MKRRDLLQALGIAAVAPQALIASPPASAAPVAPTPTLPEADPRMLGFDPLKLDAVRTAVVEAVERDGVPGASLLVARRGRVVLRTTVGFAGLRPTKRAVVADTVFDLASVTKPAAAGTAVAHLYEAGKIDLEVAASRYLPALAEAGGDTAKFTVRHLLTHTAGLIPGGAYGGRTLTLDDIVRVIASTTRRAAPGEKFIYSDYSAVLLGAIVQAVSGVPLDVYTREHLFAPLGMAATGYNPGEEHALRCASTSSGEDTPSHRGKVHDPMARALGGVSGNAGLFSTTDDLARFCQMWLNGGEYAGVRVLKPETVRLFTSRQSPEGLPTRGLGWDLDSPYSFRSNLPQGSYGHTGFTGTGVWIDPTSQTFLILLTNAVHGGSEAQKRVISLRRQITSLLAASITDLPAPPVVTAPAERVTVQTGLEALVRQGFQVLRSAKGVGVVCNHTAVDRQGRHLVDILHGSGQVKLAALYGPEHSIRGDVDASAGDSRDAKTGLPVFSLYNLNLPKEQRYRPSAAQLAGVDTLVFDIQDIGARYYTYIATMGYCLEEASKRNIRIIVLDRPNPLGGHLVEGPLLEERFSGGFTAYHTMPITHGMTVGELARMFNTEKKIGAKLEVIPMPNWRRGLLYDQTGLPWVNPSPNMRNVRAAWLYPGVGFLEVLPLSVGRGTDTPFEIIGAPYINGEALANNLTARSLPGVSFSATRFTPTSSVHRGKECGGVKIDLRDRAVCRPSELGIHLAHALISLYPQQLTPSVIETMKVMIGSETITAALSQGTPPNQISGMWSRDVASWKLRRASFLLYPD